MIVRSDITIAESLNGSYSFFFLLSSFLLFKFQKPSKNKMPSPEQPAEASKRSLTSGEAKVPPITFTACRRSESGSGPRQTPFTSNDHSPSLKLLA